MDNLIVIGILLVLVGAAVLYIWKEKKKGTRCIGCPAAGHCLANGCGEAKGNCNCHTERKKTSANKEKLKGTVAWRTIC